MRYKLVLISANEFLRCKFMTHFSCCASAKNLYYLMDEPDKTMGSLKANSPHN